MSQLKLSDLKELAQETPVQLDRVKKSTYGRNLEDFEVGDVYVHPRGITIPRAFAVEFPTQFLESNPLYLNKAFAALHGYRDLLVSPLMVMNVALSLGVQNDSEQALANL